MRRSPLLLLAWLIATPALSASPALAQVMSRPSDSPTVIADSSPWFVNREPVQVGADFYYPAGATVFFNGNTMVKTGTYRGVPLYSDTTIEPFSIVYVPMAGRLMRPYERRRDGDLAGTTASRTPSFPVAVTADPVLEQEQNPAPAATAGIGNTIAVGTVGTNIATRQAPRRTSVASVARPTSDDGLWIQYLGEKWVSSGSASALTQTDFREVGSYSGFPVYARRGLSEQVIYIPTRDGFVAPYRLKQ